MAQPMYQRIADDLRKKIDSGAFTEGSQLPTELKLGAQYGVSRNTVRDAIKQLISQCLIETRHGQGTFVTTKVDPFVTMLAVDPHSVGSEEASHLTGVHAEHRKASATPARVGVQAPPEVVTRRLRVPSGTQLVSRHQERYIDDVPWSLQTSFYPLDFINRGASRLLMAEDIPEGAVRYLAEVIGLTQIGYRDWITARSPDSNEQTFFRISHDLMVFEIFRTAFDQHRKPMRVTVTVFPTNRNQFIVNVGNDLPDPKYDDKDPGDTE